MQNVQQTIISQYANSPTLNQLIESMNGYIDPRTNLQAFYDFVWNIETAQGFGLDYWGKIVGVSRTFKESANSSINLADADYRLLLMVKALANISATNAQTLNTLLRQLFQNRRCYVLDAGKMQMNYIFEFDLTAIEYAILTQSNVLPRPAGVRLNLMLPHQTFGFDEAQDLQPFDQGVFFN